MARPIGKTGRRKSALQPEAGLVVSACFQQIYSIEGTVLKITDLNRNGGIDANSLLLEWGPFRIVFDAGLSPRTPGKAGVPRYDLIGPEPVDLIILSHCHLDHLGSLPVLMREQPEPFVLMSAASMVIARRMLKNSYNVMVRQREEAGVTEYPLFSRREIDQIGRRVLPLLFDQPRVFTGRTGESLVVTLHPAGHIPGAASVTLQYRKEKLFLSGDVLFAPQNILEGARLPRDPVETLVLETTRGRSARPPGQSRATEVERLLVQLNEVLAAGGSFIMPTFALGRMQEVLAILHEASRTGRLPKVPIFASGLGLDLVDYFDEIARKTGACRFRRRIIEDLGVVRLPETLLRGRLPTGPAIYVLSSGMMVEQTPAYVMMPRILRDPKNFVAFIGYCDHATPGGRLLAADPGSLFRFDAIEKEARVEARVERFDLSSHAEREELVEFALSLHPRNVVLTHGEPEARAWFAAELAQRLPHARIIDPEPLRTYEI